MREGYAWLTNWLNIMETLQDRAGNPDISAILGAEGLIGVREKAVHPAVPSNASICASLHEPVDPNPHHTSQCVTSNRAGAPRARRPLYANVGGCLQQRRPVWRTARPLQHPTER